MFKWRYNAMNNWARLVCTQGLNTSGFDAYSELSSLTPSAAGKPALA